MRGGVDGERERDKGDFDDGVGTWFNEQLSTI
jgi:hypothetical protein